jgi:hypothetical protein
MSKEFDPEELLRLLLISPTELDKLENIPPFMKEIIKQIHETFIYNLNQDRHVIGTTYIYGALIGAYLTGRDPKISEKAEQLVTQVRQSERGKKSGEARKNRPWHKRVEDLAIRIASEAGKQTPYATIAKAVLDQWDYSVGDPPTQRTIEAFISKLDKLGKLPQSPESR